MMNVNLLLLFPNPLTWGGVSGTQDGSSGFSFLFLISHTPSLAGARKAKSQSRVRGMTYYVVGSMFW